MVIFIILSLLYVHAKLKANHSCPSTNFLFHITFWLTPNSLHSLYSVITLFILSFYVVWIILLTLYKLLHCFSTWRVHCSGPVPVTYTSDFELSSSKEFFDIQGTIECRFTLKRKRDMIRIYRKNRLFEGLFPCASM